MNISHPKSIVPTPKKPKPGISGWCAGLLLAWCAILMLGCGGSGDPKVDTALDLMESDQEADRVTGLEQLMNMKSKAKDHADKVVEMLEDDDKDVRKAAVQLIIIIKHKTPESLAGLVKLALDDPEDDVKSTAMNALLKLEAYDEFAKIFKKALADGNSNIRNSAAMAMAQAGQSAAAAAEKDLVIGLKDRSSGVRMSCAMAIGNLGDKASAESKTALEAAANDKDKSVANTAKESLKKLK